MTTPNPLPKFIADILLHADKAVNHLALKDEQRVAIEEIGESITQAVDSLGSLDRGSRLTSKRLASEINGALDKFRSAALALLAIARTVEDDTAEFPITGAL